jgi:hypothetical protein
VVLRRWLSDNAGGVMLTMREKNMGSSPIMNVKGVHPVRDKTPSTR